MILERLSLFRRQALVSKRNSEIVRHDKLNYRDLFRKLITILDDF